MVSQRKTKVHWDPKLSAPLFKGSYEDILKSNKKYRPLKRESNSFTKKGPIDIPGILCGNLDTFKRKSPKLIKGAVKVGGIKGDVRGSSPRLDVRKGSLRGLSGKRAKKTGKPGKKPAARSVKQKQQQGLKKNKRTTTRGPHSKSAQKVSHKKKSHKGASKATTRK